MHRENCFTNCAEKLFRCKFGRSRVCLTNGRHEAALLIQSVHHQLGIMCGSTDLYFYKNFLPHLFPCLLIDFDLCLSWLCLCLWSMIIDYAINHINFFVFIFMMMQSIRLLFLPAHILILLFVFLPAPVSEYQIEMGSNHEHKKRVKIVFKKV